MSIKSALSSLAFGVIVAGSGLTTMTISSPASACAESGSGFIGSICATAASYCPRGYVAAVGGLLPISANSALFAVIGTAYGGDGRSTMGVPDLRGRTPVGAGQGTGLTNVVRGQLRGSEVQQLSLAQMPVHSHTAVFTPTGAGSDTDIEVSTAAGSKGVPEAGDYLAVGKSGLTTVNHFVPPADAGTTVPLGGVTGGGGGTGIVTVNNNGGSQEFYIVPPQQGVLYCMNTDGLFPPRN